MPKGTIWAETSEKNQPIAIAVTKLRLTVESVSRLVGQSVGQLVRQSVSQPVSQ